MYELLKYLDLTQSIYLNALIKFGTFIIVAVIIDFILTKVIKAIVKKTKTIYDDYFINVIHLPILLTIILLGLYFSINSLSITALVSMITERLTYSLLLIIWMIALIVLTKKIVEVLLVKLFHVSGLRHDTIPIIISLIKFVIFLVCFFLILTVWDINLVPIIASASIISAIILLAGKDTISNFFAGFSIILDRPYTIGDYIDLDNTERGEVVEIGLRSTRIKTRDDILIAIPNSIIGNSKIINESAPEKRFRVRIPISVTQGTNIDKLENLLLDIASHNTNIVPDPEPRVRLRTFAAGAVNYELLCWAKEPALRGLTIHEINRELYKRFSEAKINFSIQQQEIFINQESIRTKTNEQSGQDSVQ